MPRDRHGAWTQAEWDAAEERDAERRVADRGRVTGSRNPARCTACGHWGSTGNATCRNCGLDYAPAPLVGMPPAR